MTGHKARLLVGVPAGLLCLLLIALTMLPTFRPLFGLIVCALAVLATSEYFQMAQRKGEFTLARLGIIFSGVMVAFQYLQIEWGAFLTDSFTGLLVLFAFITFVFSLFTNKNPLLTCAVTLFPLFYLAIPLSFLFFIRFNLGASEGEGVWWLLYLLCVVKGSDIGALYIGRSLGKNLMARSLSPKKTIEGALGGLLVSVGMSFILYGIGKACTLPLDGVSWVRILVYGVVLGVIAQVGDLIESLLKRDAGVKDSSSLPGLGGVLDILDSLVFASPLLYFLQRGL